ncbi:MAG: ligase-associated DNA damage response endonuclease PdeM [Maritimibacter sp.]
MSHYAFTLAGARLALLPSGALYWADERLLCLSDLHLGRSTRYARNAGALLPPYESRDTLTRLEADLAETNADTLICLGDSFDDDQAAEELAPDIADWLTRLMAGRRWVWIQGNHDPGPVGLGGSHMAEYRHGPLTFRHIAEPGATGEISGHYHPKARLAGRSRPCLLHDTARAILPAYGTYTGGLRADDAALDALMAPGAIAVMLGDPPRPLPMRHR